MNSYLTKLSREKYLFPALLLLLNFILKGVFINSGGISGDEPFTIFYSQVDYETFFNMLKTENNPPLFFVLIHYWIKLFGISAVSTRFLPLVFSTLTVLYIYKTGIKFFNLRVALIASLLFTFSNFNIFFAHETRVYSLFALLTTVSIYSFLSLAKEKSGRKHFALLTLTNALLIYSHFFGFFVLLVQAISVLTIKDLRNTILKKYAYITAITMMLYAPYIKLLITRFAVSAKGTWIPPSNLESLYNNLWKFSNAPVNTVIYLGILLSALVVIILKRKTASGIPTAYAKVILIWFLVPYLLIFLLSFITPMFLDRYLIFISIGYYFTIALAINYLDRPNWLFYALSSLAVLLMMITCNPKTDTNRNTEELVNTIVRLKTKNAPVFLCPEWIDLGFAYYYNPEYFKDYKHTRSRLIADKVFPINSAYQVSDSLLATVESAVYLDGWSVQVDKDNLIYEKLRRSFSNVTTNESFHGYKVYHFTR
jgi:uncharacterized membrane protein